MRTALFAVSLTLLWLAACKDKDKSRYEGCCGAEPTADVVALDSSFHIGNHLVNDARVYIPNIFSPDPTNQFGNNALFMVFGGEGASFILSEILSSDQGEVLFSRDSFQFNDGASGWTGLKADGTYYYGPFRYAVKAKFVDGQIKTYTGKACSYKCGDPYFPNERLPDCFFPTQNNGNGEPDQNQPYDKSCFD